MASMGIRPFARICCSTDFVTVSGDSRATLGWAPSVDAATSGFQWYYVDNAEAANTPYTLLTPSPVPGVTWADTVSRPGTMHMVRAPRLYPANMGTYVDLSQGTSAEFMR